MYIQSIFDRKTKTGSYELANKLANKLKTLIKIFNKNDALSELYKLYSQNNDFLIDESSLNFDSYTNKNQNYSEVLFDFLESKKNFYIFYFPVYAYLENDEYKEKQLKLENIDCYYTDKNFILDEDILVLTILNTTMLPFGWKYTIENVKRLYADTKFFDIVNRVMTNENSKLLFGNNKQFRITDFFGQIYSIYQNKNISERKIPNKEANDSLDEYLDYPDNYCKSIPDKNDRYYKHRYGFYVMSNESLTDFIIFRKNDVSFNITIKRFKSND